MDEKCIKLAELHSKAVDFVKTGENITLPKNLIAREWPDFMEKQNKLITYESTKVLGRLYREIVKIIQESEYKSTR
jgi:RNA-dependent RNA polymerase